MDARRDHDVPDARGGRPCHGCGKRVERSRSACRICCWLAGVVAHVAAHALGAAAYAIKAARAAALDGRAEEAGRLECEWQRTQLPSEIRDLVLDDQKLRNEICWFVFDC